MPVITFADALAQTHELKRHLLLGNGFSIALFPNRFTYGSLLDSVEFTAYPQAKLAFEALATTDFEVVIQALRQAVTLLPIYGGDSAARALMEQHAEALKEALVQAIAGKHPERPSDVAEEQYQACRRFLAYFAGNSRDLRSRGGKDLRGSLFSVNYDLLLYWTLLHDEITIIDPAHPTQSRVEVSEPLDHNDGFLPPDDDPDAEYVTWDGEESYKQSIFFLHGALHLFDYGPELQKKCWERSGGIPLIDQIRAALDQSRFPLFVSEGNSEGKLDRIRHSAYLHKGLRSFRANCDVKATGLFVFGHSFADNDTHILDQIRKGKCSHLFVSIYGDPESEPNRQVMLRANRLAALRLERNPLTIQFFDAASANVWGELV
jgi:hypothetical protein